MPAQKGHIEKYPHAFGQEFAGLQRPDEDFEGKQFEIKLSGRANRL